MHVCVAMIAHGLALLGYMKDGIACVHVCRSGSIAYSNKHHKMELKGHTVALPPTCPHPVNRKGLTTK